MPATFWEKTKGTSKKGFDKAWNTIDKLEGPVNRLSYRVGAEAFWPMNLERENEKAARILRSFCKDGFYANEEVDEEDLVTDSNGKISRPKGKQRVLKKIPSQVIRDAKGLAIFTTMRTGLWLSGSGGSGVLLGRIPETGEWSPPSGIMMHTAGVGFLAGVDVYDCVLVINTYEALEAFKKVRCTLGGEVSASAGPFGLGGVLESEVHKRQAPIWTYMKSRGLYAGVQIDGTIVIERTDENERFFGERISVIDILAGKARYPPSSINTLIQTIKAAQGDTDVDENLIVAAGETPGDVDPNCVTTFGIPSVDDPDPYGVKALEAEGLFIREAGTKARPTIDAFEFKPNPNSPVYATFRHSLDSSPRNSWRQSVQSYVSNDRGTQTDGAAATAPTSISRASSRSNRDFPDRIDTGPWDHDDQWETVVLEHSGNDARKHEPDAETNEFGYDDEDFEVHEVSSARVSKRDSGTASASPVSVEDSTKPFDTKRQSPTFTRARLVTIPKRTPPALPPRNPERAPADSTPASPVSDRSSPDAEQTSFAVEALTELPLHPKNDDSSIVSADEEAPPTNNKVSLEKDEFHSISSAQSSDSESETDLSTKGHTSISDTVPPNQEDSVDSTNETTPKTEDASTPATEEDTATLEVEGEQPKALSDHESRNTTLQPQPA
ncbi:hypothetical protein FE257_005245 [Aspergillus nanangensis]|uniref:Ysc84 actin-binding domain-containing protein n=1 Tax=Aspergillus nanangensis TaxID=2582783 RepID=A0AAD4CSI7_ASPNN|nr:hypothetical protein FE257_005245 [Aspergillus nanangensis]